MKKKKDSAISVDIQKYNSKASILSRVKINWILYLFLVPSLLYIIVFNYAPLYGIQIAFRDFKSMSGIMGSQWVGLKHFKFFFNSYQFKDLVINTVTLSLYQITASMPMPIILAILLKYTTFMPLKKLTQSSTYAPHLISVVVMAGMLVAFTSQKGLFNQVLGLFGHEPVIFLGQEKLYQSMYVWSTVWQRTGYNAVIYIAALSSVSEVLHEAAVVDGANKWQRVIHIDLPSIVPTIVILVIMNLGNLMGIGFEKSLLLQNDLNLGRSEIISTYVYKIGIQGAQFSYATAIGIFNNFINLLLLVTANKISRTYTGSSLW